MTLHLAAAARPRARSLICKLGVLLAAGAIVAGAGSPGARELEVEDILALEGLGEITFAPEGRVIVERLRPYRTLGQEVRPFFNDKDRAELLLALGDATARPWFAQRADRPSWLGALSPSGRKAAIFWLEDGQLRLGILSAGRPAPLPLKVAPQLLPHTRAPVWVSEDELLVIETAPGEAPHAALDESDWVRSHPVRARGAAMGAEAPVTVLHSGTLGANLPDQGGALVALRADGKGRRVLAQGRFMQVSRSPDGRYAVALREGEFLKPDPAKKLASTPLQLRDIVLVDLASGKTRTICQGCDSGQSVPDWSPDGQRLLVFDYGRTAARADGLYELALDGTMRPIASELRISGEWADLNMKIAAAEYAGSGVFILARPRDGGTRDDWYWVRRGATPQPVTAGFDKIGRELRGTFDDGSALLIADNSLWRLRADAAPQRLLGDAGTLERIRIIDSFGAPITPHNPPVVTLRAIAADGAQSLRFVDTATGMIGTAPLPRDVSIVKADLHVPRAAVLGRDGIVSLIAPDAAPRELVRINQHLRDLSRPEIHKLVRMDRSGAQVVDWLILPAQRRSSPMPLVVELYPGRVQSTFESGYELPRTGAVYGPHMLMRHGYAVLRISVPLRQDVPGEPLTETGREVGLALDRVIATGLVDPNRLVLYGHSFGGYGTAGTLAIEKRFAAAVALAGPMNLISKYGQFDIRGSRDVGRSLSLYGASSNENGQAAMGSPPWVDPERYIRNSPVLQSQRISTPLLLIHGDMDHVAIGQAEEMFTALYRQGKDATLLRYWGEGHFFTRPRTIQDLDKRVPQWLAERLEGKARTKEAM